MGKFDEFNPELESWDAYAERFEFYCIAEEISDGGIKKATLLSRLGVKAYNKLRDLAQPETLMDTDLVTCKNYSRNIMPHPKPNVRKFVVIDLIPTNNSQVSPSVTL